MKVKLIYALLILNLLQFNQIRCQIDTLNGTIKHRKYGKNYDFFEQKIGFVMNNTLHYNWKITVDYIDSFFQNSDSIVLRLYDRKKRIFAIGEWSIEHGFISKVTFFDHKGKNQGNIGFYA